jgi:hypothetical protein
MSCFNATQLLTSRIELDFILPTESSVEESDDDQGGGK